MSDNLNDNCNSNNNKEIPMNSFEVQNISSISIPLNNCGKANTGPATKNHSISKKI